MSVPSLKSRLELFFPARVRKHGQTYFHDGSVEQVSPLRGSLQGMVLDSMVYDTLLQWEMGGAKEEVSVHCSCPTYAADGPCQHLWATILEADELKYLPETRAESSLRLVLIDANAARLNTKRDVPEPAGKSKKKAGKQKLRWEHRRWKERMGALESQTSSVRDAWGSTSDPDRELRYRIDVDATQALGQLRLHVALHQRKKDGEWNKGRAFAFGALGSAPLSNPLDLDIHAALQGAQGAGQFGQSSGQNGYHLEPRLYLRLLPSIARTGRLYLLDVEGATSEPVHLDEGQAWRFKPVYTKDEAARELWLSGAFVREPEAMALDEPDLVLEGGLLIAHNRLAHFESIGALQLICELRQGGPLRAPLSAEPHFLKALVRTPGFVIESTPELELSSVEAPKPHLFVESRKDQSRGADMLHCSIQMDYDGEQVPVFDARPYVVRASDGSLIERDFKAEDEALAVFLQHGGRRVPEIDSPHDAARVSSNDLTELVPALLALGWSVNAEGQAWHTSVGSNFSVRSGVDWFDLEGGIEFGEGLVAPMPELLAAARKGSKTVRLGDGSVGILPERWLESWGLLELAGKKEGEALRFAKHQGWLLDALLAERDNVELDEGFTKLRKRLADFQGVPPKSEPKSFQGTLREYQQQGLGWFDFLRELGFGGCLADDMGLGKTVQVLALLEARRLTRRRKGGVNLPSLVVAPRSVVFNWIEEAGRFTPKLKVLDYTGSDRSKRMPAGTDEDADLYITTYGTLRQDITELREMEFDYVILDEAQAIKNAGSQSAKAARLLWGRQRLALSGTPIENHLGELWSLFEYLNPGMLGGSSAFERFAKKGREQDAEDLKRLSRAIAPFFLRRTKDEVLRDLPKKTEQVLHCELKGKERAEYVKLREFYRSSLMAKEQEVGLPKMKIQVLEALLRLRQAACHPGLIDKSRVGEESAKLDVLLPMLEEICEEGHKALVFSQFTSLLSIVRSKLDERGMVYEYLDGRTKDRKSRVERFQNEEDCPLFLISIKAGGSGLNLTAADYVFLLDPWWNPAVESQAIDRVHRIGRTKPVIAYRLIAANTVEDKVISLQEEKRQLAEAILGSGGTGLRDLTREDLEALIS